MGMDGMKAIISSLAIGMAVLCTVDQAKDLPAPADSAKTDPVSGFFSSMGRDLIRQTKPAPAEDRRVAAGQLVAKGKCDEAMKLALKAGDLELAASLKPLCDKPAAPAK